MDQQHLIEAYQYLNTLDGKLLSLIPNNVWQYFKQNIDISKIKIIKKELALSDKARELVDYITETYVYF